RHPKTPLLLVPVMPPEREATDGLTSALSASLLKHFGTADRELLVAGLARSCAALSRPARPAVSPRRPRNRHPQSAVVLRIPRLPPRAARWPQDTTTRGIPR